VPRGIFPSGLFFYPLRPFPASLLADLLRVFIRQILKLSIIGRVLGDLVHLIPGDIATNGLPVFTTLKVVKRAGLTLPHDTEFTGFHSLDLSDSLEQLGGCSGIHDPRVYPFVYTCKQKKKEN